MAKLTIICDANDPPLEYSMKDLPSFLREHVKMAQLDIASDLEGKDIYEIARKLGEMLLEQLGK
jgi:hypothetical protein